MELNLATLPRDVLYLLQEGVTQEFHAREGRTFHILTEQKERIEQITLQHDELATQHQAVEQAVTKACGTVLKLSIPGDLPLATKIQHMVADFHTAQAEATRHQEELTL